MKRILFFVGDIETQGYFSLQIAEAMKKMGHDVFIYDLSKPWSSTENFFRFFEKGNTVYYQHLINITFIINVKCMYYFKNYLLQKANCVFMTLFHLSFV